MAQAEKPYEAITFHRLGGLTVGFLPCDSSSKDFCGFATNAVYGEFSLKTWNWTVLKQVVVDAGYYQYVVNNQICTLMASQNPWLMCFVFLNNCRGDSFGISSGCNELVLRCVSADKKTSEIKKNDMD